MLPNAFGKPALGKGELAVAAASLIIPAGREVLLPFMLLPVV